MATAPRPALRFDILPMSDADLAAAQGLSRAVGWPHRLEDWQFALSVGEGLVACAGDQLVGTAMGWTYGARLSRLGMVIVDPTLQRAGVGRALMHAMLERLTTPTVILNATVAGEPLYRQLGFRPVDSVIQHQGASFSAPLVPLNAGERIRPMGRNDTERLIALDAAAGGARRPHVFAALVAQAEAVVLDSGGETIGFAFYRRFGRGHVIGPVVARDAEAAKALIAHWVGSNAGMFMRIDVPGSSDLSDWLDGLGLMRTSPVVTMVRGQPVPPAGPFRAYAILNQALG